MYALNTHGRETKRLGKIEATQNRLNHVSTNHAYWIAQKVVGPWFGLTGCACLISQQLPARSHTHELADFPRTDY